MKYKGKKLPVTPNLDNQSEHMDIVESIKNVL